MATVTKPIVLDETAKIIVEKLDAINSTLNKEEPSYHNLTEKPQINGVTLDGDKTWSDLDPQAILATKDYVEQEIGKFDIIKIVKQLPEVGIENRTYFVPKDSTDTEDLYDEYMWVGGRWELIGTKKMDIDLTNYIAKTDLGIEGNGQISWAAVQGKPTLKYPIAQQYGIDDRKDQGLQYSGTIDATNINAAVKAALSDKNRIGYRNGSKVTTPSLQFPAGLTDEEQANAREIIGAVGDTELDTKLSNYVSLEDSKIPSDKLPIATAVTLGVAKIGYSNSGLAMHSTNPVAYVLSANKTQMIERGGTWTRNYASVTTQNLDDATRIVLTAPIADETHTAGSAFPETGTRENTYVSAWTEAEKARARERIGAITANDIPLATNGSAPGLVKLNASWYTALHTLSDGTLAVAEANIDHMHNRYNNMSGAVSARQIDDATRIALSSPIADDTHTEGTRFPETGMQENVYKSAWTEEEQARARARLGVSDGIDVVANPTGLSTGTLAKIKIGQNI